MTDLADRIRTEADTCSRAGQRQRLLAIADAVELLTSPPTPPVPVDPLKER